MAQHLKDFPDFLIQKYSVIILHNFQVQKENIEKLQDCKV